MTIERYDTEEVDKLIEWFAEPSFKPTDAPHKWVLQAEQELRRLRDHIAELESK